VVIGFFLLRFGHGPKDVVEPAISLLGEAPVPFDPAGHQVKDLGF
jgi:hypothetical protein